MPAHVSPCSVFKVGFYVTYVTNEYQVGEDATDVAEFEVGLALSIIFFKRVEGFSL